MKSKSNKTKLIEKTGGISSALSGSMSFLGSYQVCHNLCLGVIALLSIIGITVAGMPLLFLTKIAIPFWIAAVILFTITLFFYLKKKCISRNLIIFNLGILIAGIPFPKLQNYSVIFWIMGGTLILVSLLLCIKNKLVSNAI
ncbi:hypothetical protein HYU23_04530 [Candidatus Woesearchaeota archaeon]|nr:hypothetical protein [Candidatus Woesearchaeota archaeon]